MSLDKSSENSASHGVYTVGPEAVKPEFTESRDGKLALGFETLRADPDDMSLDAGTFIGQCQLEALSHRAVRHPYLHALATGDLPDLQWALRDFATQYQTYSSQFPRYLTRTISQLPDRSHRAALLMNLAEESGQYSADDLASLQLAGVAPEWIIDVTHPELFRRFAQSVGVRNPLSVAETSEVSCWVDMLLSVLSEGPAQAVGALGLGTEDIVATLYQKFLPALAAAGISPQDGAFFTVHTIVDDQHGAILREIAASLASCPVGRRNLVSGMRKSLDLRAGFWDWMLLRARGHAPQCAARA